MTYHAEFRRAVGLAYAAMGSLRRLAAVFGIGLSTVWRWKQTAWSAPGDTRAKRHATPAVIEFVRSLALADPFTTCKQMASKVASVFGFVVSRQLVGAALARAGMGRIRTRLAVPIACSERREQQRRTFRRAWLDAVTAGKRIVCVDECGVDERTLPTRGWVRRGGRLSVPRATGGWRRRSVIMGVDSTGVVASVVHAGAVGGERFRAFLPQLRLDADGVVVMDNIAFHHSPATVAAIRAAGAQVLFTPPYDPDANPIENVFSVLKGRFRRLLAQGAATGDRNAVEQCLDRALRELGTAPSALFANVFARATRLATLG